MMDAEKICWPGWETVQLIGRGSFGAVYEIRRDVLGETERAALKVISIPQSSNEIEEMYDDGYDDESITSTFESHLKSIVAEYSLMRKLSDCVNIVKCDDVRYVQQEDGIGWDIFIKMELLTPLTKALPADIEEKTVIKIARDMCNALDMCSKHGVIHRDIKPQNIFVSDNGDYKLGDFGIAKTVERTVSGTKIGTYKYMAPEVYNNQPYGVAADIYSLGLVLYWLLNDRRLPFLPSGATKLTAGMEEEARSRRFSGEPIPEPVHGSTGLKAIVLRACAFDPTIRFSTPRQMYEALEELTESPHRPTPTPKVDLDIRVSAILTKAEAAAGCTKRVQVTPDKALNVSFPAGVRNGAVIRLAGAGRENAATGAKGDAYVAVILQENSQRDIWEDNTSSGKKDYVFYVSAEEAKKGGSFALAEYNMRLVVTPNSNNGAPVTVTRGGESYEATLKISDATYKLRPKTPWEEMPQSLLEVYRTKKCIGFGLSMILCLPLVAVSCLIGMSLPVIGFPALFLSYYLPVWSWRVTSNSRKAGMEIARRTRYERECFSKKGEESSDGSGLTPADMKVIHDHLAAGNKLLAWKVYREITGADLAEAKAAIEKIANQKGSE